MVCLDNRIDMDFWASYDFCIFSINIYEKGKRYTKYN